MCLNLSFTWTNFKAFDPQSNALSLWYFYK